MRLELDGNTHTQRRQGDRQTDLFMSGARRASLATKCLRKGSSQYPHLTVEHLLTILLSLVP